LIELEYSGEESVRLDVFLAEKLAGKSRSQIKRYVDDEAVTVNGKVAKAGYKLAFGDRIAVRAEPERAVHFEPVPMTLDILFEDGSLLVVNKPAGISVHPGAGDPGPTLVQGVLAHAKKLSVGTGDEDDGVSGFRPGVVHRLDKGTSGALVFAKDDETHAALAKQFADKSNFRQYIALLNGAMKSEEVVYESWLRRDPRHRQRFQSVPVTEVEAAQARGEDPAGSRWSRSVFRREHVYGNRFTLAAVRLFTGRTHQIRIHARDLNLPVAGDPLYGTGDYLATQIPRHITDRIAAMDRQLLHAWILGFTHPVLGKTMQFEAPIPPDFLEILHLLEPFKK